MAGPYLVLANSRKLGGHCVAVVDAGGQWIRPVSDTDHGELGTADCWIENDSRMLQPLDVVEADIGEPRSRPYQPEDHEAPSYWRLWDPQPSRSEVSAWLNAAVDHGADFLTRGRQDRIRETEITASSPLEFSLTLVRPSGPTWRVQTTMSGGRQVRVSFTLADVTDDRGRPIPFDLVVTDPLWEERVRNAAGGAILQVTTAELGMSDDDAVYLTVSLGEPFNGDHYKLVAAVCQHRLKIDPLAPVEN